MVITAFPVKGVKRVTLKVENVVCSSHDEFFINAGDKTRFLIDNF